MKRCLPIGRNAGIVADLVFIDKSFRLHHKTFLVSVGTDCRGTLNSLAEV